MQNSGSKCDPMHGHNYDSNSKSCSLFSLDFLYLYLYLKIIHIYIYIYMISIYWFLRMILLLALLLGRCFSFASALLLDGKVGGFEQYKLESLKKLGNSLSNCLVFLLLFNISSSPKCKGRFKQWTVKCRCDDPNCLWNCFVVPA